MTDRTTSTTDVTFIHLTDLHTAHSADAQINGYSPTAKLDLVLARIQAMEIDPSFVLITGDLVNDGQPTQYHHLQQNLRKLRAFDVPILLGLGNHDLRGPFREIILGEKPTSSPQPYFHSQEIAGINVIMLDTLVPGQVAGAVDDQQLSWLDSELSKSMPVGHLIALHHPPVPCTVELLNAMGLQNRHELATIIHCHTNVLGVLSGHIHYSHVTAFANTISVTTPSVLYTVDPGVRRNIRTLSGSGFAIGTVRNGRLMMNTVMMPGNEVEIAYQEVDLSTLDNSLS